jgi:transposase-like protein
LPKSQHPKSQRALQEIWMAETKATADLAFDAFVESYALKYERSADCLSKDRDVLLAVYDFPAEHWKTLRTTNPIESTFATVRYRTIRSKGSLSNKTALAMVFKTGRGSAEKLAPSRWPQPVAKTRSRCDIQRRDRCHRQADRPSAQNRRRLTGPGRHQNLAIAPAIDRKAIMNRTFAVTVAATAIFATLMSLQKT